jgi:transposase-like protein
MKNITKQRIILRYSNAFKLMVVEGIESGKLTVEEAKKIYDISGGETVQKWIKKFGKLHLLNKVVRVEMRDEASRIKQLEKQKRDLESALAQAQLKIISYESLIEIAEEKLGIDLKKNLEEKRLNLPEGEQKKPS